MKGLGLELHKGFLMLEPTLGSVRSMEYITKFLVLTCLSKRWLDHGDHHVFHWDDLMGGDIGDRLSDVSIRVETLNPKLRGVFTTTNFKVGDNNDPLILKLVSVFRRLGFTSKPQVVQAYTSLVRWFDLTRGKKVGLWALPLPLLDLVVGLSRLGDELRVCDITPWFGCALLGCDRGYLHLPTCDVQRWGVTKARLVLSGVYNPQVYQVKGKPYVRSYYGFVLISLTDWVGLDQLDVYDVRV